MKLISLLPLHLREAEGDEKEEAPAGDEGDAENPFAAAAASGEAGGEEGADTEAPEGGEGEEEGGDDAEAQKSLEITFDPLKVRKYNDQTFKDGKGTVVGVSRFGIVVKLPDEKTVFVNFEDIL